MYPTLRKLAFYPDKTINKIARLVGPTFHSLKGELSVIFLFKQYLFIVLILQIVTFRKEESTDDLFQLSSV